MAAAVTGVVVRAPAADYPSAAAEEREKEVAAGAGIAGRHPGSSVEQLVEALREARRRLRRQRKRANRHERKRSCANEHVEATALDNGMDVELDDN